MNILFMPVTEGFLSNRGQFDIIRPTYGSLLHKLKASLAILSCRLEF